MMATFFETISEAIREFEQTGFDSMDRLQTWVERIRKAAVESLTPAPVLEEALNSTLRSVYRRMIDDGQILKAHPGISRYTVDRLKPQMRAELERRLSISKGLIKLNRDSMIEKTTQRFAGWASSVPAGGSRAVEVKEVKQNIRKSLAQLPFEERRVMIDQGVKFISSLNEIIAADGNAIAAQWHSQWRRRGYDYRHTHKARDQKVYAIRGNWALEKGLMKAGKAGYYDEITKPGEEVYCFPGDSKIPYAGLVEKAYRRWYDGELTEIVTSSGKTLRATPNHPVLTAGGWKPIGCLNEGDGVVEIAEELIDALEENQNDGIASIAEIFGALEESGVVESFDLRATDFHGDGIEGKVDIVFPAWELRFDSISSLKKSFIKLFFSKSNRFLASGCALCDLNLGLRSAAQGTMRVLHKVFPFFFGKLRHSQESGINEIPDLDSLRKKTVRYDGPRNGKPFGNGQDAFPAGIGNGDGFGIDLDSVLRWSNDGGQLEAESSQSTEEGCGLHSQFLSHHGNGIPFATQVTNVVKVNRSWFSGHVYNLQTENGWYVAGTILAHNCSCSATYVYNLRDLPDEMLTNKGRDALAQARAQIKAAR